MDEDKSRQASTNFMRQRVASVYDSAKNARYDQNVNSQNFTQNDHDDTANSAIAGNAAQVYKHVSNKKIDAPDAYHQRITAYHSAWQNYYQQYYQRYYLAQLNKIREGDEQNHRFSSSPQHSPNTLNSQDALNAQENAAIFSGDSQEATSNTIRDELFEKVRQQGQKARKSRHFWPIVSSLAVMLLFVFLQFNQIIFAEIHSYITPGEVNAQNIIIDPYDSTHVSSDPKLIIPKINVETPVIYGLNSLDEGPIQTALKSGVVHYPMPGANSVPGQNGNTVFLGHSSNDVFDSGSYKFIFVQLDKLSKGDLFYLNYQGTRYTYSVTESIEIDPNDINRLVLPNDKPYATLVTCTPIGTSLRRLLVFGEQINPNPTSASTAPTTAQADNSTTIPGNSPTLLQWIFGR
jgi:sortase A